MRSPSMPLALFSLLWLGLTCAHRPTAAETARASELLRSACERALASLAPDNEPAPGPPVLLPAEAGPALRALHGTGRGDLVVALEAALERAARLALADAQPWLADAAARFSPGEAEVRGSGDALSVAFRAADEAGLRAQLAEAARRRLEEAGALAALEQVRDAARRLPLPREVDLDLVSLVTDQAARRFFATLGEQERQLRQERKVGAEG